MKSKTDRCSARTQMRANAQTGRRTERQTWEGSCRGSGESGTGRPGQASSAARTAR